MEDLKTDSGKTEINLQHKYIRDAQVQVRLQVGPRSAALNEQLHGQVLSEALKIHKNITHLFLGGNKIQDDGAQADTKLDSLLADIEVSPDVTALPGIGSGSEAEP